MAYQSGGKGAADCGQQGTGGLQRTAGLFGAVLCQGIAGDGQYRTMQTGRSADSPRDCHAGALYKRAERGHPPRHGGWDPGDQADRNQGGLLGEGGGGKSGRGPAAGDWPAGPCGGTAFSGDGSLFVQGTGVDRQKASGRCGYRPGRPGAPDSGSGKSHCPGGLPHWGKANAGGGGGSGPDPGGTDRPGKDRGGH